jgi:hypothetical protein
VRLERCAQWHSEEVLGRTNCLLSFDTTHIENNSPTVFVVVVCVLLALVMFSPNHCLATIGGYTHRLMGGIYEVCC